MSLLVPINGQNYIIPTTNEVGWGSNLDAFFVAISAGVLQKTGGNFVLSAETDFGSSFGLKSLYYKTRASNVASTGAFRLANAETGIVWRNALNNGDLPLTVNSSNELTFNGSPLATGGSINPGTQFQLAYYATSSSTISGLTLITASRALASNSNGLPVASTTTATELGFVAGVTSAIQTQLDSTVHLAGTETIAGAKTFSATTTSFTAPRTDTQGDDPILLSDGQKYGLRIDTNNFLNLDSFNGAVWSTPIVLTNTGNISFTGQVLITDPSAAAPAAQTSNPGGAVGTFVDNQSNTASSDAAFFARVAGTSAGDPYMHFNILGSTQWVIGTDNSDSDRFKVSQASTLGTNDYLIIDPTTTAVSIKGTNTNNSATAGFVGEVISSAVTNQTPSTAGQFGDLTSISLTAGDWILTAHLTIGGASPLYTALSIGISTTSGNSSSGLVNGDNELSVQGVNAGTNQTTTPGTIAGYHVQLSGTTIHYFKTKFTSGDLSQTNVSGRITAVRIR